MFLKEEVLVPVFQMPRQAARCKGTRLCAEAQRGRPGGKVLTAMRSWKVPQSPGGPTPNPDRQESWGEQPASTPAPSQSGGAALRSVWPPDKATMGFRAGS